MWSSAALASDIVLRPECKSISGDALGPAAAAKYYEDLVRSDLTILSDGEEPPSKAEILLNLMSIEGSYGNSAVLTTNESSWTLDWEKKKASYAFKLSVPFDIFQKWDRAGRAREAAEESKARAMIERRSEFIKKLLSLRDALTPRAENDGGNPDIIALQLAAQSKTFADRCIVQEWLPAIPKNRRDLPF